MQEEQEDDFASNPSCTWQSVKSTAHSSGVCSNIFDTRQRTSFYKSFYFFVQRQRNLVEVSISAKERE